MDGSLRKTVELTPALARRVERLRFAGLLVLVIAVVGAPFLDKVMHVNSWLVLAIFVMVMALDMLICVILLARIRHEAGPDATPGIAR